MSETRSRTFTIALLGIVGVVASPVFAPPAGSVCGKKCCLAIFDVPGLGEISLALAGSGFAEFPAGAETNPESLAEANLNWSHTKLYGRHPMLGLVSLVTRFPESTSHIQSVSGSSPLFPANATHDLFFQLRVDGIDMQMFNAYPSNPFGYEPNPLTLVSDSAIVDLTAEPSTYTATSLPVVFFDENDPTVAAATLISAFVEVIGLEGFTVSVVDFKVVGMEATVEFSIQNDLGEEKEIVYYVSTTGDLDILEPLGDPRLLGNAQLALISNEPLPVTVIVSSSGEFDDRDSVFLAVTTMDGSKKGGGAIVDVATSGGPIPTVSEWGVIAMTLLMLTALTVVLGRRRPAAA